MASMISNLIARLSLDSADFDRGAQRSRQSLHSMTAGMYGLQKSIVAAGASYFSARGIAAGIRTVTRAAMEQETAERRLRTSLSLTSDATESNVSAIRRYARQLQQVTIYGDEEILGQIAYAKSIGLATQEIGKATVAAIGLASAYNKDLGTAMRYIALAARGETGQLKEMGIVIDKNLSPQEAYSELIRQMTDRVRLATDATQDAAGAGKQLANTWSDTKELIGRELLPGMVEFFRTMNVWLENNQGTIQRWSESAVRAINSVADAAIRAGNSLARVTVGPELKRIAQERYRREFNEPHAFAQEFHGIGKLGYYTKVQPRDQAAYDRIVEETRAEYERENAAWGTGYKSLREQAADRPMPTLSVTGAGQEFREDEKAVRKHTMDIAAAYRAMYGDLDRMTEASFDARRQMLQKEYEEYAAAIESQKDDYEKYVRDKAALDEWYAQKRRRLEIEQAKAGNDAGAGMRAAVEDMRDSLGGMGGLAYTMTQRGLEGIGDAAADAALQTRDLRDALREVAMDMARMGIKWAVQKGITSIGSAILGGGPNITQTGAPAGDFSVPVGHAGGMIGGPGFPTRRMATAVFAHAPRLHEGLKSDEFAFVGQRGEKITSKAGVAAESRLMGRMVQLLERIAAKETTANVAVVRSRDEIVDALRSRQGRREVMRIVNESA